MKAKILGLLAVGLLAGPLCAHATITIDTDSATMFAGSFNRTVIYGGESIVNPELFQLGIAEPSFCDVFLVWRRPDRANTLRLGGGCESSPTNNLFLSTSSLDVAQTFSDYAGMYNQMGSYSTVNSVYFRLFNLRDSGGADGAFAGNFCYSTAESDCASSVPEPGTLALLGLGLLGLAVSRRKA